jgi:hypothetical protein
VAAGLFGHHRRIGVPPLLAVAKQTIANWTVLKTWPSLSISDSIRVGGWEMIRCATSLVFLISMIG